MVKKAYSVETKLACIEMKKAGKSTKVIMETLGIKNKSQVRIWWRWYKNDELHRFHQPVILACLTHLSKTEGVKSYSLISSLRFIPAL